MITRRAAAVGLATALIGLSREEPLATPSAASPVEGLSDDGPTRSLSAQIATVRLKPDAAKGAEILAFDGRLGQAVRVAHGVELRLSFKNETSLPLSLHFQGVRGPNAADGVGGLTQLPIAPGQSQDIRVTPPDPGTFLIRPCVIGGSAEPLERGLSALLIVEERSPPPVDLDLPLLIDDWRLDSDGALSLFLPVAQESPAGRLGNLLSVNGDAVPQQIVAAPGSRLRLRLANACNARAMRLRFDILKPTVIAVDGQPAGTFEPLRSSLPLAPGNRYDLLVDLPPEAGAKGMIVAMIGDGMPLVEIVTEGEMKPARPAIGPLPQNGRLPKAIALEKAVRKDLLIRQTPDSQSAPWTINGKIGEVNGPPLLKIGRGSPVVLTLINDTTFVQPFHLHGHVFRLLHALDDGWQPYFLDTVQVPENKTVRIAFVADNPGRWLLASSVMERFDAGLWSWIEVS